MSKSYRDHKGPKTNGEIGRVVAIKGDIVCTAFGYDSVGSPLRKRNAKNAASRARRIVGKVLIKDGLNG